MAKDPKSSEPFVSQQDRPTIHLDTPLSELRVKDLQAIMGGGAQAKALEKTLIKEVDVAAGKTGKDFWDHDKHLKDIFDHLRMKVVFEAPPDPRQRDPINQIGELQNMIGQLANEVAALKAKIGK